MLSMEGLYRRDVSNNIICGQQTLIGGLYSILATELLIFPQKQPR